jgi:hypothetical protein
LYRYLSLADGYDVVELFINPLTKGGYLYVRFESLIKNEFDIDKDTGCKKILAREKSADSTPSATKKLAFSPPHLGCT